MKKTALIIGLGISGKAVARALLKEGWSVVAVDRDIERVEKDAKKLGIPLQRETIDASVFDLVIPSPGVAPSHPLLKTAKKVVSEIELAAQLHQDKTWLGITGTNGKTTVTLLVAHVLNAAGIHAKALGNVGEPLIEHRGDETIVAELSSFQLETMHTKILSLGVILNITPDHLDRYPSMQAYAEAKWRIQEIMKDRASLYVPLALSEKRGCKTFGFDAKADVWSDGTYLWRFGKKELLLEERYRGKRSHDVENLIAAYALCRECGVGICQFQAGITTFKKPAHRIEFVATVEGVHYFDDSKGTNLDAVIRAVESFDAPIVLIAGGVHKGASYKMWIGPFERKVKALCTIGQASNLLQEELGNHFPTYACTSLSEAVMQAKSLAKEGEIVLLSPGCSSYDMFRSYAHRGSEFKKCVLALQAKRVGEDES